MFDEASTKPVLSVQDYWDILLRRRWWLLFPLFICWLGAWSASWIIPAKYRSETLILVEQQEDPPPNTWCPMFPWVCRSGLKA